MFSGGPPHQPFAIESRQRCARTDQTYLRYPAKSAYMYMYRPPEFSLNAIFLFYFSASCAHFFHLPSSPKTGLRGPICSVWGSSKEVQRYFTSGSALSRDHTRDPKSPESEFSPAQLRGVNKNSGS